MSPPNTAVDSIDERYTLDREITQDRVIQLTRTKNLNVVSYLLVGRDERRMELLKFELADLTQAEGDRKKSLGSTSGGMMKTATV